MTNGLGRSVAFSDILVHEFSPEVGDHPCVSGGVPVALSDRLVKTTKLRVESYEAMQAPKRRTSRELRLDGETRLKRLNESGCRQMDIVSAIRQSRNLRHARELSVRNRGLDSVHEALERARRKMTKPLRRNSSSELEFMLQNA